MVCIASKTKDSDVLVNQTAYGILVSLLMESGANAVRFHYSGNSAKEKSRAIPVQVTRSPVEAK